MNGKIIIINNKIKQSFQDCAFLSRRLFLSTNLRKRKNLILQIIKVTIALMLVFMFYLTMLIMFMQNMPYATKDEKLASTALVGKWYQ